MPPAANRYQLSKLANGLSVATVCMPHMASVSVGIWVGVGSRYEAPEESGAAHFIEHMVFKGTRRRTPGDISAAIEGIGGSLNAWTSEENTSIFARVRHDLLPDALDVLLDMLHHSRFAPADISKERDVIKEEISMYRDQPQQHVHEVLNAAMWPGQPLGRSITGTEKTVDKLGRRELQAFLRSHYVAGRCLVVAAGQVRHAPFLRLVRRTARAFATGPAPGFAPAQATQSGPVVQLCRRKTEQTQIALGFRACSRHDERRFALRVLNAVLGENMSSRLFQVLRETHGLTYHVYSLPSHFADAGDLVISAGLDAGELSKTLNLIFRELRRLRDRPVGAAELRRARDYLVGQMDLSLESTENQMNWIGEQWSAYGKLSTPGQLERRLARVTAAEVQAVARDFFRPSRLNLALVSPLHDQRRIERLVSRFQ